MGGTVLCHPSHLRRDLHSIDDGREDTPSDVDSTIATKSWSARPLSSLLAARSARILSCWLRTSRPASCTRSMRAIIQ
ncbi:hypothetical protein B296_00026146 [Ensete ventricosum]|uniref:Uncharacterized protein n=1 Tax=Ensete ventricosum TaxID=4639 RepID=A0A427APH1_ENSVE|nr:hypothetical protein B296_00026146 [Ensete ventricosum]